MTAAILHFPGPGPVFGGAEFQTNALDLARKVFAADVPNALFWDAVATLMESPFADDRAKGRAAYDARLLAQYSEPQEPFAVPHAASLIPGWMIAGGVLLSMLSVGVAAFVFGGGLW